MAHKLLEVARKNTLVVAIVGEPHLEGINEYWRRPIEVSEYVVLKLFLFLMYRHF